MLDDNFTSNLLNFPAPTPLPTPAEPAVLADISTLEVAILATLWNYHPRPLRISEIYLGVRTAAGSKLESCANAINRLGACGLVSDSGAPFFRYHLNHDGIFTTLYLAIAGAVYTFNTDDHVGGVDNVLISYSYALSATGTQLNITNQLMGFAPTFQVLLATVYNSQQMNVLLYSAIASKLNIVTKQEDFIIPEFDFEAFANAAGQVIDIYSNE
jgi:hypothetical protein